MHAIFKAPNAGMRWIGWLSLALIAIEPWVAVVLPKFGMALAGTGIIGLGTYLEYHPYFRGTFGRRLVGGLILMLLLIVTVIYSFGVFALVQA